MATNAQSAAARRAVSPRQGDEPFFFIGAVIILMLWLYIAGVVILLGSEINALVEHYSPRGKLKGEKKEGERPANGRPAHSG